MAPRKSGGACKCEHPVFYTLKGVDFRGNNGYNIVTRKDKQSIKERKKICNEKTKIWQ